MQVLVMTAIAENDRDLEIVIVVRATEGGKPIVVTGNPVARVSPIITLEGEAHCRAGNPYLVYGDAVEEFTGCAKFDTTINVFDCRSGDLTNWR